MKQETVSSSGISWVICKSAPRSRHITTPAPHHSFFIGRMTFLSPNQQCQSTEGINLLNIHIFTTQSSCVTGLPPPSHADRVSQFGRVRPSSMKTKIKRDTIPNTQLPLLHPFNGLFCRTTWVSRYQKGKTSLDLNEARDDGVLGRQWHQLDHMQATCTSLQTDGHNNTSSLNFYRPDALPDGKPTVSEH